MEGLRRPGPSPWRDEEHVRSERNASGQALSAGILQSQALSAIDPQAIEAIEARMT